MCLRQFHGSIQQWHCKTNQLLSGGTAYAVEKEVLKVKQVELRRYDVVEKFWELLTYLTHITGAASNVRNHRFS